MLISYCYSVFLLIATIGSASTRKKHGTNSALSRSEDPSCAYDFLFLPTGQGLIAQFEELRNFWSHAHRTRRVYVTLHHSGHHFPDVGRYSMCDIFNLDGAVTCLNATATEMVDALPLDTCLQHTDDAMAKVHGWLMHAEAYNLSSSAFKKLSRVESIPWNVTTSLCAVGGPIYVVPFLPGADLPIIFQKRFIGLLDEAKKTMMKIKNVPVLDINSSEFRNYVIVHWRRGDQTLRCITHQDTSVNCGTPEQLIAQVQQIFSDGKYEHKHNFSEASVMFHRENDPKRINPKDPPPILYLATNEGNETVLRKFSSAGFITFRDLRLRLNSLEQFIVELQMMIDADYYLAWGVSSIHDFVRAAGVRGRALEKRIHPERFQENYSISVPFDKPRCTKDVISDLLEQVVLVS